MTQPKAVIFGCQTTHLLPEERVFFERTNPLGFILFARNCQSPSQITELVRDLRQCVGREDAPILIDQEGGRVTRLPFTHWRLPPPAGVFGALGEDDPDEAMWCARANAWLIARDLKKIGISVDCAPVVDVLSQAGHPIIGDRAFSSTPEMVSLLATQAIQGFFDGGIIPVLKHIPGHGRALVDSHEHLPVVSTSRDDLVSSDFLAFSQVVERVKGQSLPMPWGMTAHVVYQAIDPSQPATLSSTVIEGIIRGHIGFSGLLLSDCLTMKALTGTLGYRTKLALESGCDVVLHCSGVLDEMIEVIANTHPLRSQHLDLVKNILPSSNNCEFTSEEEVLERLENSLRPYVDDRLIHLM